MSGSPPPTTPSSVKLFVGQVSRAMTEEAVADVFSPYGRIQQVVVIRDRLNHAHRGCAFVTYETQQEADAAVAALHGIYRCEGMQNPLQIAAASGRVGMPRNQILANNKLYVGGFSASCGVEMLTQVFSRFGNVLDVSILKRRRSSDNLCCAFIRLSSREEARAAIDGLTDSTELDLDSKSTPLVVKYAEQRERSAWPGYSGYDYWGHAPGLPMYNPYFMPMGSMPQGHVDASIPPAALMPQYGSRSPPQPRQFGLASVMGGLSLGPSGMGGIADGIPSTSTSSPPLQFLAPSSTLLPPPLHLPLPLPLPSADQIGAAGGASAAAAAASPSFRVPGSASSQDFATVYVYNLPLDWTDHELNALGSSIASLQRATVCVNRGTCSSKGYGFLVFDDPKFVPQALQTICATQVAPGVYLSAQMSHASMSALAAASFAPHPMMPPHVYMPSPLLPSLSSGARARSGRVRGRGSWAGQGGRQPQSQRGAEEAVSHAASSADGQLPP